MSSKLLDRVETKRFEKYRKFTIICSVTLIILGAIKVFMNSNNNGFRGIGYWFDTLLILFVFPVVSLFLLFKKDQKNRTGQFIEWWDDKLIYKSKDSTAITEILHGDVIVISIKLDSVEISTKNDGMHVINLFDYTDYDMRLRIKANFEQYKVV